MINLGFEFCVQLLALFLRVTDSVLTLATFAAVEYWLKIKGQWVDRSGKTIYKSIYIPGK